MSIHPTTTSAEIQYVCDAIIELAENFTSWASDYEYNSRTNEFSYKGATNSIKNQVLAWFY